MYKNYRDLVFDVNKYNLQEYQCPACKHIEEDNYIDWYDRRGIFGTEFVYFNKCQKCETCWEHFFSCRPDGSDGRYEYLESFLVEFGVKISRDILLSQLGIE